MSRLDSKQRWSLVIGGSLLTLLLAAVFTFGSLEVPFEPSSWRTLMPLYAVSSFITAALLVFGLILGEGYAFSGGKRNRALEQLICGLPLFVFEPIRRRWKHRASFS